jgi:hypothetical protein
LVLINFDIDISKDVLCSCEGTNLRASSTLAPIPRTRLRDWIWRVYKAIAREAA